MTPYGAVYLLSLGLAVGITSACENGRCGSRVVCL